MLENEDCFNLTEFFTNSETKAANCSLFQTNCVFREINCNRQKYCNLTKFFLKMIAKDKCKTAHFNQANFSVKSNKLQRGKEAFSIFDLTNFCEKKIDISAQQPLNFETEYCVRLNVSLYMYGLANYDTKSYVLYVQWVHCILVIV